MGGVVGELLNVYSGLNFIPKLTPRRFSCQRHAKSVQTNKRLKHLRRLDTG